jgi:multidrug resistance efflux pump
MTNIGHRINSADARRRQIRVMQLIFAGAATVATLALFSAGPSDTETAVASGRAQLQAPPIGPGSAGRIIAVNDDDVNNPSSGDIFTQNAQDQSTANGAGT